MTSSRDLRSVIKACYLGRVSLTLQLMWVFWRSLLPFLTCIYGTLPGILDLEMFNMTGQFRIVFLFFKKKVYSCTAVRPCHVFFGTAVSRFFPVRPCHVFSGTAMSRFFRYGRDLEVYTQSRCSGILLDCRPACLACSNSLSMLTSKDLDLVSSSSSLTDCRCF